MRRFKGRMQIDKIVDIAVIVTLRAKSALKTEHHLKATEKQNCEY